MILPRTKRVLCLGNKQDDREQISYMLKQINPAFEITSLDSVSCAISLIGSRAFDLYILDHRLGEIDGPELCRWIRKDDKETPIMFLTERLGTDYRKKAKEAGVNSVLVKPVEFEEFSSIIRFLLKIGVYY